MIFKKIYKPFLATLAVIALSAGVFATEASAQPKKSRIQQRNQEKQNTSGLTTRAQISFPTSAVMNEDVVWRRDIYREINLMEDENAGLY